MEITKEQYERFLPLEGVRVGKMCDICKINSRVFLYQADDKYNIFVSCGGINDLLPKSGFWHGMSGAREGEFIDEFVPIVRTFVKRVLTNNYEKGGCGSEYCSSLEGHVH